LPTVQEVQTFKIKRDGGKFNGFERDAAGNLVPIREQLDVVGGFKLLMRGELKVASIIEISALVQFRIELAGANPGIELVVNGTMDLGRLARSHLVDSGFRIDSQAWSRASRSTWTRASARTSVSSSRCMRRWRSTPPAAVQSLGSSPVQPGFLLHIDGEVEFLGFVKGSGSVDISISANQFQITFALNFLVGR